MTPEQFCYWLQGFAELRVGTAGPTDAQWRAITEHLQTVFHKVTPPLSVTTKEQILDEQIIKDLIAQMEKDKREFGPLSTEPFGPSGPSYKPGEVIC